MGRFSCRKWTKIVKFESDRLWVTFKRVRRAAGVLPAAGLPEREAPRTDSPAPSQHGAVTGSDDTTRTTSVRLLLRVCWSMWSKCKRLRASCPRGRYQKLSLWLAKHPRASPLRRGGRHRAAMKRLRSGSDIVSLTAVVLFRVLFYIILLLIIEYHRVCII